MDWIYQEISAPDPEFYRNAEIHQSHLTKPPGSLGRLEEISVRLAAMQRTNQPKVDNVWISVFAADHGVAEAGVSAFPQSVTTEMVRNFVAGGAAINVLARHINAHLEIVDTGVIQSLDLEKVICDRAGNGTNNFIVEQAMNVAQFNTALNAGKSAVERALNRQVKIFIGGEMGIGNTTSATAIACALGQFTPIVLTGTGTGLNQAGLEKKVDIIEQGLERHQKILKNPLQILQCLGGFEIVALVGAYIAAAQRGLVVLIDGFIATVAAYAAVKLVPQTRDWFFYAHTSAEKGHQIILDELQVTPLLDLGMRLGEGSGAVTAVTLLRTACALHNEMATFEQAQVSTRIG